MSLLAELLSKIKLKRGHGYGKTDIPPGLKNVVSDSVKKESLKKRITRLLVVLLVAVVVGGGVFGSIYMNMLERYRLSASLKKDNRTVKPTPVQPQQQTVSQQHDSELSSAVPSAVHGPLSTTDDKSQTHEKKRQQSKKTRIKLHKELEKKEKDNRTPAAELTQTDSGRGMQNKTSQTAQRQNIRALEQQISKTEDQPAAVQQQAKPDFASRDAYLYSAKSYEFKKDYQQALLNYKKALELDPKNYIIINNIAGVLINMELYEEAIKYLKDAMAIKKDYPPSLVNLGIASIKLNDISEGERHLLKALSIEPLNRSALLNLAILYEKQNDNDKAYGYFLKLSQNGDIQGMLGVARISEKQGMNQEAARIYREILTINGLDYKIKKLASDRLFYLEQKRQ